MAVEGPSFPSACSPDVLTGSMGLSLAVSGLAVKQSGGCLFWVRVPVLTPLLPLLIKQIDSGQVA